VSVGAESRQCTGLLSDLLEGILNQPKCCTFPYPTISSNLPSATFISWTKWDVFKNYRDFSKFQRISKP